MKIAGYAIDMKAVSKKTQLHAKTQTLDILGPANGSVAGRGESPEVILNLSGPDISAQAAAGKNRVSSNLDPFELSEEEKMKLTLIQKLLEAFTGKKMRFSVMQKNPGCGSDCPALNAFETQAASRPGSGFGAVFTSRETYFESEKMSFSASGIAKTEDGRTLSLDLTLNMSRAFYSAHFSEMRIGAAAVDPLVINFNAPSASLTDTKYAFDLDVDGDNELMSFVGAGSGFLALDLNGDGLVNNGSELFGTVSGNGFADLAVHDHDNNGWIDENDPIYDNLRIWVKNQSGKDSLLALGKTGVGAIFLGNVRSDFALKDADNYQHGEIRRTGIFLFEDGGTGTVSHVDLTV
ncbi:MAG: hypothetical protein GX111_08945 [Clostridiales bacterium]|nr:hypothetical protein [Clostridiales bacterium]